MEPTVEQKMQKQLDDLKTGLETSLSEKSKADLQKAVTEMQTALESKNADAIKKAISENIGTINDGLKALSDWRTEKNEKDEANQKALDGLLTQIKEINLNTRPTKVKTFGELFNEALAKPENIEGIASVRKGVPFKIELFKKGDPVAIDMKVVGDMTTSGNLTGDSVATYSTTNALLKGHRINLRDLIPTTYSPTGLYVHYKESGGEGAMARQTEGSDKDQVDYDFTEVKTASSYVQGFARFSKQMMKNLPWLQGTLPRLLMRDFFKKENSLFFTTAANAATGSTSTVETDSEKLLLDLITNQLDANFDPSFCLISNKGLARILKNLYTNGYYQGSGSIVGNVDGTVRVMNVPLINASWVTNDKILIVDKDFLERIEVESVAVEFFEQDYKNVTQNKITARIECLEEINPMLPSSLIYADGGNASF
jgi:hypothetical protein